MSDSSPFRLSSLTKARVAVLVDGDNFPYSAVRGLEAQAETLGEVVIRRVFGDVKKVGGWPEAVEYQMLHCDSSLGRKNLADMHLTVAAMDLAQRGLATQFVIASDDRDFEPVAQFLIETGRGVMRFRKPVAVAVPPAKPPTVDQRLAEVLNKYPGGASLVTIGSEMKAGAVMAQTGKKTWRAYFAAHTERYVMQGQGATTLVLRKP